MKKLILSSGLVGLVYGLMLYANIALFQGIGAAAYSFVQGAVFGAGMRMVDIPKKLCGYKPLSGRYFAALMISGVAATLTVLPLGLIWPSVSPGWALLGLLSSTVVIVTIVRLFRRRSPANPA